MPKHSFKNMSDGPRVLNSNPPQILQPGGETDGPVDISDAELKSMRSAGYFEIDGSSDSDELVSLSGKNKDQLLQIAKDEGADVPEGATNAQIVEAIEKKRAS